MRLGNTLVPQKILKNKKIEYHKRHEETKTERVNDQIEIKAVEMEC